MDEMIPPYYGGAQDLLSLQPDSSISIAYHSQFGPHDDLMLLELDENLLTQLLNQRVTLRGLPEEEAVLCTETNTYAIKFVGTSNSLFLVPPSHDDAQLKQTSPIASVIKLAPGCMELVEVAPKIDKLKSLLSQNPYTFPENESSIGLYTWNDLVNTLQASDGELRSGLKSLSAVEINGYWRVLDDEYMNSILKTLLEDIVLNDWSINALNEDEVVNALELCGYPSTVAKHCLQLYASKVEDLGLWTWKLDEKRVCVQLAREILKGGKLKMQVFMDKWLRKVPDGMRASIDMLEGEVLTEKLGIENWVYLFSVSSLPSTPAERFRELFKERGKWESKDLQPYVRDLRVPGVSLEGLLLKYTRRTQPSMDAEPIFSAR